MITGNTDYSIQRLRGLSTDTKPVNVPNGSEFREMDTGKDFMYDADNESWEEQPKKGGGGGAAVLTPITITENGVYLPQDYGADGFDTVTANVRGSGDTIPGVSWIRNITLTEPVRAVQIDIPSGYDWVYVLINGEFTAEDWLYWGINSETSSVYMAKTASILMGFVATNRPQSGTGVMTGFNNNDVPYIATVNSPMEYIHLRGYAKDFKVGTKIYAFGGKYADM